ncbi:MAG: flavin reductase [Rhodobacteraceae bacterium]|nr:flavin reductase [Paracoccaceae bacterium]
MSTFDTRDLRAAFGSFLTGVTVVTARGEDGVPVGFTANSFTSVSLEPPLLLVCPGRFLSSFDAFKNCRHFAVSVLAEGQENVSNTFASFKGDRFARVEIDCDLHDIPVIRGAAAVFSCETAQVLNAGDHALLMGEVRDFRHSGAQGLGYAGGKYFSLGLEQRAASAPRKGLENIASAIIENDGAVFLLRDGASYALPQVVVERRGLLRDALGARLHALGLDVELAQVYSIYDRAEVGEHHTCFRAAYRKGTSTEGHFVPINQLAEMIFSVPGQSATLKRYAMEHQTGQFGLYVGDVDGGDIHYH